MFIVMQLAGGLCAVAASRYWFPLRRATELVVPHDDTHEEQT
jgi:hypothetical protein